MLVSLPMGTPHRYITLSPRDAAKARKHVLGTLQHLANENPPGALLSIREARERASIGKETFDQAILALRDANLVTLHHHDHPHALSRVERGQLAHDVARDVYYVGVALRKV